MKISSLIDIISGELLNSPAISSIYSFKADAKKVIEADLFFARNEDEADIAISNGAFAIVFEGDFKIKDEDIAYIKVDNLELAMKKIIRYRLLNLNLKAFYCTKPTFDLLRIYRNSNDYFLISKNISKTFKFLDDIEENDTIFCHDIEILKNIYPNYENFEQEIDKKNIKNLIEHSLFETTFSYKDRYFYRLKLPSLYIDNFLNIFLYLNKEDTEHKELDFSKLKQFYNTKPIFIDKNLQIVEFGKSNKFIICQNSLELIENEALYIQKKYKYAKTTYLCNKEFLDLNNITKISSLDEIKTALLDIDFNCLYLIGFSYRQTLEFLQEEKNFNSLF